MIESAPVVQKVPAAKKALKAVESTEQPDIVVEVKTEVEVNGVEEPVQTKTFVEKFKDIVKEGGKKVVDVGKAVIAKVVDTVTPKTEKEAVKEEVTQALRPKKPDTWNDCTDHEDEDSCKADKQCIWCSDCGPDINCVNLWAKELKQKANKPKTKKTKAVKAKVQPVFEVVKPSEQVVESPKVHEVHIKKSKKSKKAKKIAKKAKKISKAKPTPKKIEQPKAFNGMPLRDFVVDELPPIEINPDLIKPDLSIPQVAVFGDELGAGQPVDTKVFKKGNYFGGVPMDGEAQPIPNIPLDDAMWATEPEFAPTFKQV